MKVDELAGDGFALIAYGENAKDTLSACAGHDFGLPRLTRIAINPHYRKITPMVADELARWGDWRNAIWIWESVLSSRPYVVVLLSNIARGYASIGNPEQALAYLERARKIQPDAPAVRSLEVILLSRTGKEDQALQLAREALKPNVVDYDMLRATIVLAKRGGDFPLPVGPLALWTEGGPQAGRGGGSRKTAANPGAGWNGWACSAT